MKKRSSHNSTVRKVVYTTGFFALVIVTGLLLPKFIHSVGSVVMMPVHTLSQWYETSEDAIPVMLREKRELQAEIERLEEQLLKVGGQDLTIQRLQDENVRLRSLLGVRDDVRTGAAVIARPNELPYDLLQIDRGRADGIAENALVYIGTDQVIGTVKRVANDYSFVELFTTSGVEMTGFISGPDIIATVEGVGGGVARVKVPQGIPLRVGDLVYVPSIAPGLFGRIDHVENRPSQPEQFGYITLPVSLQSLFTVAVADTPIEPATVADIESGRESIVNQRLLIEEANTGSFEELLATSTPTSTVSETAL